MTNSEAVNILRGQLELINPNDLADDELYNLALAVEKAIKALEDRPKGKWIVREDLGGRIQCDNCGCFSGLTSQDICDGWELTPYCSQCGADMRGDV